MQLDADLPAENRSSDDAHRRLLRIADILGCSVGDFLDPATGRADLRQTVELLRFWSAVTDEAVRADLLDRARAAASAAEDVPAAAG